jgi:hypothetical protein
VNPIASTVGNDEVGDTGDVVALEKKSRKLPNPPARMKRVHQW